MLKEPCPYHQGPVKHTLEECVMLRRYFHKTEPPAEDGKGHDNDKKEGGKEEGFPEVHNCFMIYGGQAANASAWHRKQERREVCLVKVVAPVYLDWSDNPITFDRGDHPDFVPSPGRYLLIVDPIIGNVRLSKVLMDGGSSLNIIYAETLEHLGVDRSEVWTGAAPFHGIAPKKRILSLGRIDLSVCFGTPSNFQKEALTFEVVGFRGTYHAVLGRPCYAKFMAVPNYTYLKLKMPGPNTVILTRRKLRHYFESHPVTVVSSFPLGEIIQRREASGRIAKWAVELMGETLSFAPRKAIKSQVLADFLAEWTDTQLPTTPIQPELWTMCFDGSLMKTGAGAGLLFVSPLRKHLCYVIRLHFPASNNVAEYEALVNGLRIAIELGVWRLDAHGDS
jgi:hypothetical protein